MSDRGEHTEAATRPGEAYAVRAIVSEFGTEREETRQMVDFVYPIIAAAVRAEEREQIAQRIEEKGERFTATTMTGRARRSGYHDAARLARGSS